MQSPCICVCGATPEETTIETEVGPTYCVRCNHCLLFVEAPSRLRALRAWERKVTDQSAVSAFPLAERKITREGMSPQLVRKLADIYAEYMASRRRNRSGPHAGLRNKVRKLCPDAYDVWVKPFGIVIGESAKDQIIYIIEGTGADAKCTKMTYWEFLSTPYER